MNTPAPARDGLLTIAEVKDRLKVDIGTVYALMRQERLIPAVVEPYAKDKAYRYFNPADVDAVTLRKTVTISRATQREVNARMGGKRCSTCHEDLSLSAYRPCDAGMFGVTASCVECLNRDAREYARRNRLSRIEYKKQYRRERMDHVRQYKREYERRITAEQGEQWEKRKAYMRAYHRANRPRLRSLHQASLLRRHGGIEGVRALRAKQAARRQYWTTFLARVYAAVKAGQSSPITRRGGISPGFVVVRDGANPPSSTYVRAARLDKPLAVGERVVVRFEEHLFLKRWILHRPSLAVTADDERAYRLVLAREGAAPRQGRPKTATSQEAMPL